LALLFTIVWNNMSLDAQMPSEQALNIHD
jgi:hypothetical protein